VTELAKSESFFGSISPIPRRVITTLSVGSKGEQREPRAFDCTERDDDFGVRRNGQRPSLRDDIAHALAAHVGDGIQPDNMAARYDHQTLFHVIEPGLAGRLARRFQRQMVLAWTACIEA
jgi:hypothetical protein